MRILTTLWLLAMLLVSAPAQAAEVVWKGVATISGISRGCTDPTTPSTAKTFNALGYDRVLESSIRPGNLLDNVDSWLILGHGPNLTGYKLGPSYSSIQPSGTFQGQQITHSGVHNIFSGNYSNFRFIPALFTESQPHLSLIVRLHRVADIADCSVTVRGRYQLVR